MISFDIVCLQETWCLDLNDIQHILPGYFCYFCPAKQSSKAGRNMGGVVIYIKEHLVKHVKRICEDFIFGIILVFKKVVFGLDKDVLFVLLYNPPLVSFL